MKSTYITVKAAALRMDVTEQTMRKWARTGVVKARRVGRSHYVDEGSILDVRRGKR